MLEALKYNLDGIVGCIAGHSHKDHCKALLDVAEAGVDCYASQETLESVGLQDSYRADAVADKTLINSIDGFQIYCFDVHHDCKGSLGFVIREIKTNEYLLYAIDTAYLHQKFPYPFSIIMIECSFDHAILADRVEKNDIHEALAKRLLTSHMSKDTCLTYLRDHCDLSKCREIHLLHMSGDNIDKKETRKEFEDALFLKVI